MKYVLTLEDSAMDSQATIDSVKNALMAQGARNVELHGMGLVTVDSDVSLNFAAINGVANSQEVFEVGSYRYMVYLTDSANVESVKETIANMGAGNIVYNEDACLLTMDSDVPLNFAGIDGVQLVEGE